MDESEFKQISQRLKEANAVVAKLDPALRPDAWAILRSYVSGSTLADGASDGEKSHRGGAKRTGKGKAKSPSSPRPLPPDSSEEELIENFESNKDSDNLYLALAIFYKRHGRGPVPTTLLKSLAKSLGLDIPNRPDMTFGSKKTVVRKMGDGWKIMPGGEKWLKETFGVSRGKDPLPSES